MQTVFQSGLPSLSPFTMYLVRDTYGTRRACWSMAEAMDWLRYCSPNAWIESRLTRRVLRVRIVTR